LFPTKQVQPKKKFFEFANEYYLGMQQNEGALFSVIIATEAGIPLYSKTYGEGFRVDESLILAFFSALKSFARSVMQTGAEPSEDTELRSIRIGKALLDFESAEFEAIGRVDVLLLSEKMDRTMCQAVLSEITEKFAIFLDNFCAECPGSAHEMQKGKIPKLQGFDAVLDEIVNNLHAATSVDLGVTWSIPTKIYNLVQEMFKIKPLLAETYKQDVHLFLEQILMEYANSYLEKDIKRHFRSIGGNGNGEFKD
jgi:hypothetical protein